MENTDQSILLQFAKFSKGFRISDFDEFVQEHIGVENVDFFGRLAYPNQWQIRLTNPDLRERLIRMGRTRIKNRSCWMFPLNQQEIRGFVHWLPNSVTNDLLMEHLNLYGNVLFIESQERTITERKVESDPRYYGLILSHGTIKEDIPHFLKINGFLCLVVVRGREPACFHCKEVGHFRAVCPKYKAKLISYCNRDPNTAPTRQKPRGRRHVKGEEIKDNIEGDVAPSGADSLRLEGKVHVDKEGTDPQSSAFLDDRERATELPEEATSSPEKKLTDTGALAEQREKSYLSASAASFSEIQDIVETLQQIQRRTTEDLQRSLKNFEKKIVQSITREKSSHSTGGRSMKMLDSYKILQQEKSEVEQEKELKAMELCPPKETSMPVEMLRGDFNVEKDIKETKAGEIRPILPIPHLNITTHLDITTFFETLRQKSEAMVKDAASNELTTIGSTSLSDSMRSILLILEQTKKTAAETLQNTFKKLEEFSKSNEASQTPSKDSAAAMSPELTKYELQSELVMLEQAKQIASGNFDSTFKKLEEEIASLSFQLTNDQTDSNTKLTKDDIHFAYEKLKQAKETVGGILENTFGKLTAELAKETKPTQIIKERSTESGPPSKIPETSTKSAAISERFEQEAQSTADKTPKGVKQPECDPADTSQDIFKAAKISESSAEREKEAATKQTSTAIKELESHISKATRKNINELQENIRKVFTSVLANDELLPEARTILKQVETKVNEAVEEMKTR